MPDPLNLEAEIDNLFTYHAPSLEDLPKYRAIREAGRYFARVLVAMTPAGADQCAAVRKVREAVFTANAAIACERKDIPTPAILAGRASTSVDELARKKAEYERTFRP